MTEKTNQFICHVPRKKHVMTGIAERIVWARTIQTLLTVTVSQCSRRSEQLILPSGACKIEWKVIFLRCCRLKLQIRAPVAAVWQAPMISACASMRQSVFPHMARNMLTSCCQSVTSCLPHHTVEVTRAYATRPAKQQQMVNILGPPAIVMDTSEAWLSDSCFSVCVHLLCSQPRIRETTWRWDWQELWQRKTLITDVMSSARALWRLVRWWWWWRSRCQRR